MKQYYQITFYCQTLGYLSNKKGGLDLQHRPNTYVWGVHFFLAPPPPTRARPAFFRNMKATSTTRIMMSGSARDPTIRATWWTSRVRSGSTAFCINRSTAFSARPGTMAKAPKIRPTKDHPTRRVDPVKKFQILDNVPASYVCLYTLLNVLSNTNFQIIHEMW